MDNRQGLLDAHQLALADMPNQLSDSKDMRARRRETKAVKSRSSIERHFDPTFATRLALREKQIQQNYRPVIGIHKWFARRPGTVFRSLLLAEALENSYWREHKLKGVIADPFMGGGTPIFEANRLGFSVLGADTNPMAYWVVRQALGHLDLRAFVSAAEEVTSAIESTIGKLYETAWSLGAMDTGRQAARWLRALGSRRVYGPCGCEGCFGEAREGLSDARWIRKTRNPRTRRRLALADTMRGPQVNNQRFDVPGS